MKLFQFRAQFPLEMWINHRQRLVKHHNVHIVPNQPTAHRDFLLVVRAQTRRARFEHFGHFKHLGNFRDPSCDRRLVDATVLEWKG